MGRAGAKRIRFVEKRLGVSGPLEEYMLDSGWTCAPSPVPRPRRIRKHQQSRQGQGLRAAQSPRHALHVPAFDLNHAFEDTDVFVSMAKLNNHETCGVTLSLKKMLRNTPASIYGDNSGVDEPNEKPTSGRGAVCHAGKRQPSRSRAAGDSLRR